MYSLFVAIAIEAFNKLGKEKELETENSNTQNSEQQEEVATNDVIFNTVKFRLLQKVLILHLRITNWSSISIINNLPTSRVKYDSSVGQVIKHHM